MNDLHASIDIGSNTLRLFIARAAEDSHHTPWQLIEYKHAITRLGQGLHQTGKLSDTGMAPTLRVLRSFSNIIAQYHIPTQNIHAVATAAMREARNGIIFRDLIKKEAGLDVQIIGGDLEAQSSLAGSLAVLDEQTRENMMLFDIGGGSTEFMRAYDGKMMDGISKKLGVVRLVEEHLQSDPPSPEDYQAMKQTVHTHLEDVEMFWQDGKAPKYLVGTAGTVTTLAAIHMDLVPYNVDKVNNHIISIHEFQSLKVQLLALNHQQRQDIAAIETGREDLIIAGLAIIESIMERWHYDQLITVDAGLLEGIWLNGLATS
ncbi:MAG: Ppx/GppA family phosphatase [Mariprofundaceae bacterium]